MRARGEFTDEFKANAVKQFLEMKAAGKTIPQIEKELGINNSSLYKWTATAKAASKQTRPGVATMLPATTAAPPSTLIATKNKSGRFSAEIKEKALQMIAGGMSLTDVGKQLKVKVATVSYWNMTSQGRSQKRPNKATAVEQPAKAANGIGRTSAHTDALIFLRQAEREIMEMITDGKISRPDQAHLLTLLALGTLTKALGK